MRSVIREYLLGVERRWVFLSSMMGELTCIEDRFVCHFEQHPQLRIHGVGLFGMNTEKGGIKLTEVLELATALRKAVIS